MKRLSRLQLLTASVALAAITGVLFLMTDYRPSLLFVRWTDAENAPFTVSDRLEIASRGYPLKRSSASLLCGPDGTHLMLKTRFLIPTFMRRQGERAGPFFSPTRIEVMFDRLPGQQIHFHSFWSNSAVVRYGPIDTAVTAALSKDNEAALVEWFRRGAPQVMSVFVADIHFEYGLTSLVEPDAVATFLSKCRPLS